MRAGKDEVPVASFSGPSGPLALMSSPTRVSLGAGQTRGSSRERERTLPVLYLLRPQVDRPASSWSGGFHLPLLPLLPIMSSAMQQRKAEILAKRAKLAELKRQRELRQKEFSQTRANTGDASEV